ncbi:hypothetical protein HanRHA438_Chr04g0163261 [Helianthus annuus]|nr:hypothetical protein HanRHA438_Chr04g0163261 [Helianthus annuus]
MLKTEIKIESSGVMDKLQKEKGCKPTRFSCFILIIMYKQAGYCLSAVSIVLLGFRRYVLCI